MAAGLLARGSLVEAHGLSGRADLNGKRGIVNGRIQGQRLGVDFPPPDGTKALCPERLMLLREAGELAPMPQRFPAPVRGAAHAPRRRILAYGDSLTAGYRSGGERFSPYATALAAALAASAPADLWVCGLSALSAAELLAGLEAPRISDSAEREGPGLCRALEVLSPDLALLMAGTNDLGGGATAAEILEALQGLHSACHDRGVRTVALSVPPCAGVLEFRRYRQSWEALNRALGEWASAEEASGRVLFVDTGRLVPFAYGSELWEEDNLHLSEAGSRCLGEGLAPLVGPFLAQAEKGTCAPQTCKPSWTPEPCPDG